MTRTSHANVPAFTAKDGSTIRELMHPNASAARHQSLAEATLPPGIATTLHRHHKTEEIYHILAGEGEMTLESEDFAVRAGDSILIRPGVAHRIRNAGASPLTLLCACAPAYSDADTELLE